MSASTVPISESSQQLLQELAARTGRSISDILDSAIDEYRRKLFLDAMDSGYGDLQSNPQAWAEHLAERRSWDVTLSDGLDGKECWSNEGRCEAGEAEG
jgi:hypothetical protein